jgi:virginiamycin B lyase
MLRARVLFSIAVVVSAAHVSKAATGVFHETVIPGSPGGATDMVPFGYEAWYFTEFDANRIGMISRDGQFREFLVPSSDSGPRGIAVGSLTRAIWFTEFKAGKVGKLTFDGIITEYVIPTPQSAPWGIAEIDGLIWFTESAANKIGRLNKDGSITEFTTPSKDAGPRGIFQSFRNEPCFAEFTADRIGCFEGGQIVERALAPGSGPEVLFRDDYNPRLWFTESTGNRIGAANFNGIGSLAQAVIEEYPIPTPASGPAGIVAECSGGVWFTEKSAGQIGFLSPSGRITEYPLADRSSQPTGITLSLFGASFLESVGNRIVEIQPDAVVIPGAGTSGRWETEIEVASVASQPASILAAVYPRGSCISLGYPPPGAGLSLPANGSGKILLNQSVISGLRTFYVKNTEEGILPVVRARIYNRDVSSQSADLPTIRLSTLTNLNPETLSFPGAVRNGSARTNLLIAELSIERLVLDSPIPAMRTRVDILGSDGVLLASGEFDVTSGTCLYLVDIIGRLGVTSLQDGQIRVTKLGNQGLLWGYSARIDSDNAVSIFSGLNP